MADGGWRMEQDYQPWATSENFWKVWQSAGTRPRLTEKVHVTSLT
jgi:hypothetical protein